MNGVDGKLFKFLFGRGGEEKEDEVSVPRRHREIPIVIRSQS